MEVIRVSSSHLTNNHPKTTIEKFHCRKPIFANFPRNPARRSSDKYGLYAISPTSSTEPSPPVAEEETDNGEERFDWFAQWYPVMPVCDLDKRIPHAKKVIGIDVVVWWDRNENDWKVFDDMCPHRLAPLSEGRIDQWGRLQCVYHGWCFNGSGDCKFIPQAPPDGPPVHTSKKACVGVYPSIVQNDIVWFWPKSDPQYKDILIESKPPFIPELDDPSFSVSMGNRDIPYGYEILVENLMDPSHVPYSHYGILPFPQSLFPQSKKIKADREGGRPLDLAVTKIDINGFIGGQEWGSNKFIAPCIFYTSPMTDIQKNDQSPSSDENIKVQAPPKKIDLLIFFCIPVSPGKSRLIWAFPRNFDKWIDRIVPRWLIHIGQNLILDSDTYLLHVEEHKIMEIGPSKWQKACYVPVKSDALVVGFRRWLSKYSGGQVNWGNKFSGAIPPTPPREQLLDRYWTHVVNCSSCRVAHKSLKILEVVLQVIAISTIGITAAVKPGYLPGVVRVALVSTGILCFVASRWLSHFIYKTFHFHDYYHALL